MTHHADIDMDFPDRDEILDLIDHIPATQVNKGKRTKHRSGVYVHKIPLDPKAGGAAIDFREADDRGYFKIDFLNVSVYQHIRDPEHYETLLATTPPWHRLADPEFTKQLVHLGNHPSKVKNAMPDSIPRLAMLLAALRPAKKHLIGKPWKEMGETIWEKNADGLYGFKKGHSLAYATLVALHMNIIHEQETNQASLLK